MTNRERIIVGVMIVVVVYGVYTLFFSSRQKAVSVGTNENLSSLNTFVEKVAKKTKTGLSQKQTYLMKKAQEVWKQDPFVHIKPQQTETMEVVDKPVVSKSDLLYTGYLQMGNTRLAIINGIEYEKGDKLEPGGFIIRNIQPNHIVIAPANRKSETMILPMEESE